VPTDQPYSARFCVLGSGSGGNCSVLDVRGPGVRRVILIDLGFSPQRTKRLLHARGLGLQHITDIVITHFDQDHWRPAWNPRPWEGPTLRLHRRHIRWADKCGALTRRSEVFDDAFTLAPGIELRAALAAHDQRGSAALRFEFSGASIGFATDLGHVTNDLIAHLSDVDLLAIESNYDPRMQAASPRPAFLKNRIMGGAGHLSNAQCADAVRRMSPRSSVVLLHLSRECNRPELAREPHAEAPYALVVSSQHEPTPWIEIEGSAAAPATVRVPSSVPAPSLFAGVGDLAP